MAVLVTNRAEKSAIIKRFQSYGNDSMAYSRDHFEQNKCEECCELQGGRLNFYESAKPHHNTTATVVKVEKRRGTNILILRCGPGGRAVIFLEFDSKRLTDEWQEALCRCTGQPYDHNPAFPRVRSELPAAANRWRRRAITQSTFSDFVFEQADSDPQDGPVEAPQEAPPAPPVASSETPQEAPQEAPPAPLVAPSETPQEASLETPQEAPLETPQETPLETPQKTPLETPQETPLETPQEAPLETPQEAPPAPLVAPSKTPQEAPLEAPPAPSLDSQEGLSAPHSPPGSPTEDRVLNLTSDTSDTDSGPDSLRSRDADLSPTLAYLAKNSVEKECTLSDLQKLKVKDCRGDVIVKELATPLWHLHVGDKIVMMNDQGRPMNAREITKLIHTSPEPTIVLTIVRGAVCIVREEESELAINIKRSQTVRLDTVDLILRAFTSQCSLPCAEMPARSKLTITEINNIPVSIGSQTDQIAISLREALDTSKGYLTIRLVPQSLLDALAEEDDDTHDEQAHDMVDE